MNYLSRSTYYVFTQRPLSNFPKRKPNLSRHYCINQRDQDVVSYVVDQCSLTYFPFSNKQRTVFVRTLFPIINTFQNVYKNAMQQKYNATKMQCNTNAMRQISQNSYCAIGDRYITK